MRSHSLPAVLLLLAAPLPAQLRSDKSELVRVSDRIYSAAGYALGNALFVLTDDSVVVIDTTESVAAARAIGEELRKITALPVSHIIYTHFHGDHINGARAFHQAGTKVVAQRRHAEEIAAYRLLAGYNRRLNALQFGTALARERRGVALAIDPSRPVESGYVPPDVTFDEEYSFEQGGIRFELYHAPGETPDHVMLWLPQLAALFPGDLVYDSFPMLSSPMKPDRPVLGWAESVERMRRLGPALLVGSHSRPMQGREAIDTRLADLARAIRLVHDETVRRVNLGLPLHQIRDEVRLPADLAPSPYLREVYGTVPWSVNGILRQYTGWYDFNPTHLNAGSLATFHRAVVEAAGGAAPLLNRAQRALEQRQWQLALELTDVLIGAGSATPAVHTARAEALERLGEAATNSVARNIYLTAAAEHRKAAAVGESSP